jgi:alpha-N-arabinofuranosidase
MVIQAPILMFFKHFLYSAALLAYSGPVLAGQKLPRAGPINPRQKINSSAAVSLNILTESGVKNATAPYLYGWMFEDINHSGDGGLYGELLTNRAFDGSDVTWGSIPGIPNDSIVYQENACEANGEFFHPIRYEKLADSQGPVITGYKPLGNTTIRLSLLYPLTHSHPTVLGLDIPTTGNLPSTQVGFQNMGWWGIPVTPQTYNVSFYIYPDQARNTYNPSTSITVSLQSNITGEVWASTIIPAQSWNVVNYTYVTAQIFNNVTAPDVNNSLAITFDSIEAAGQTYYFDQISLFGETFKGYQNGLRKDLAQNIYDLGPKFLRWPGGNNIEGYSIQRRWKWWETIGPLEDRWPRPGNWGKSRSSTQTWRICSFADRILQHQRPRTDGISRMERIHGNAKRSGNLQRLQS